MQIGDAGGGHVRLRRRRDGLDLARRASARSRPGARHSCSRARRRRSRPPRRSTLVVMSVGAERRPARAAGAARADGVARRRRRAAGDRRPLVPDPVRRARTARRARRSSPGSSRRARRPGTTTCTTRSCGCPTGPGGCTSARPSTELGPGSAFRLRPREVHIVENTSADRELTIIGLFTPAGSPSAAYLDARGRRRVPLRRVGLVALSIPVTWSEAHRRHAPETGVWLGVAIDADELPARADRIRAALEGAGATVVEAESHDDAPLLAVHDAGLVEFLRTAWSDWERGGLPRRPGAARRRRLHLPHSRPARRARAARARRRCRPEPARGASTR